MKKNFQRAKLILDRMLPALPGDGVAAVKDKINALASLYPGIWNPAAKPIDYSDAATQAAYVFTYFGANAGLIYQTLCRASTEATGLLTQRRPRIACVGGGPGSDLLGLVKFAERMPRPPQNMVVEWLDHHLDWWDMWDHTLSTIPRGMCEYVQPRKMDYLKKGAWVDSRKFLNSDIFLFSYSLSEVWRYNGNGAVTEFLDMLFEEAKEGSLFIYSDNSGASFDPHFEREFLGRSNLRLVDRHHYERKVLVGGDEEASDLEPYRATFDRSPKLKGNATCAALVKV